MTQDRGKDPVGRAQHMSQRNPFVRHSRCKQVVSWDEGKGMVDTHYEDGRSYISAVSEVIYDPSQMCEGNAKVTHI